MKPLVLYLSFFFLLALGWDFAGKGDFRIPEEVVPEDQGEAKPYADTVLWTLAEANHYGDVTVQSCSVPGVQLARRYRPAGCSVDKWFTYLTSGQQLRSEKILKTTFLISQGSAASRKDSGYFIYHLRKIII